MPLYELREDIIKPVPSTSFAEHGVLERKHLQHVLRSAVDVIAPNTMVLTEEFGEWEESLRRIDLLALDEKANLVVIELKRNEDGAYMDLQAIRYAAMVSTMTFARAVDVHQRYLQRIGRGEEKAHQVILDFLEWDAPREEEFAQDVRIVLAAANFSKELTTTVMWLNERQLDVSCVRIQPYSFEEHLLVDVQQVIPLPEATAYQIQLKEKAAEQRVSRMQSSSPGPDFTRYDLQAGGVEHKVQWKRNMIYHVVRAAWTQGLTRERLPVPEGKWFVVDAECADAAAFEAHALQRSPGFKAKRWFAKDRELFRHGSQTFALSNQWSGPIVLPLIDEIAAQLPELEISYKEAEDG